MQLPGLTAHHLDKMYLEYKKEIIPKALILETMIPEDMVIRLNELLDHTRFLPEARFHFIAPLQSRKIREIMNSCEFIHTLQRPKEILAINECYENQDIFVQINIDDDPNKSGININGSMNFLIILKD